MKTLVIANEKGGVGKTTLTAHLAYLAQQKGLKVLLVDMDRQGSIGLSFPGDGQPGHLTSSMLYKGNDSGRVPEKLENGIFIIRADAHLLEIDLEGMALVNEPRRALAKLGKEHEFDLCLIDTPPTLGPRLVASLAAANFVVTPVSMGLYEMAGVQELVKTIMAIRKKYNPVLKFVGVLALKTNPRRISEMKQLEQLREDMGDKLLPTMLPERAAVRNAVESQKPVWESPRGESHVKAAGEWKAACELILNSMTK